MVILVGGSSHVGKTLISNQLMLRHHIPYLSLDHLKMGFIRTKMTDLTVEDDYEMKYFMWPFVSELIKTVIENSQDIIIEGCYIPVEWQNTFDDRYLKDIRSLFIVMSESYLRGHLEDVIQHANEIEKRIDDEVDLERLIRCSHMIKEDCIEHDLPYLEIDQSFNLDEITNTVSRMLNLI